MFGKRTGSEPAFGKTSSVALREAANAPPRITPEPAAPKPAGPPPPQQAPQASKAAPRILADSRSEDYYQIKSTIFNALIDTIDLAQLAQLDPDSAREEIRDIVNEIISIKAVVMSIAEQEHLLQDICNDVLGYGPLEPLLARDDIADIMVNGANRVFIEVAGKVQLTNIRFRDNAQLMNICQRIVSPRWAAAWMKARRSATRACWTAPASTSSARLCRWTAPPSPSESSRRTS